MTQDITYLPIQEFTKLRDIVCKDVPYRPGKPAMAGAGGGGICGG